MSQNSFSFVPHQESLELKTLCWKDAQRISIDRKADAARPGSLEAALGRTDTPTPALLLQNSPESQDVSDSWFPRHKLQSPELLWALEMLFLFRWGRQGYLGRVLGGAGKG